MYCRACWCEVLFFPSSQELDGFQLPTVGPEWGPGIWRELLFLHVLLWTEMAGLIMAEDGWWKQRWPCHTTSTRIESPSMIQQLFSKMGVVGGLPFTGTTVLAFPSCFFSSNLWPLTNLHRWATSPNSPAAPLPGRPAKHVTWAAFWWSYDAEGKIQHPLIW